MPDQTEKTKHRFSLKCIHTPPFIREWLGILKKQGFMALLKQKGWKVVITFFLFYLIRDSLIYLILPYLAAKGLLGC